MTDRFPTCIRCLSFLHFYIRGIENVFVCQPTQLVAFRLALWQKDVFAHTVSPASKFLYAPPCLAEHILSSEAVVIRNARSGNFVVPRRRPTLSRCRNFVVASWWRVLWH